MASALGALIESLQQSMNSHRSLNDQILQQQSVILARLSNIEDSLQNLQDQSVVATTDTNYTHSTPQRPSPRTPMASVHPERPLSSIVNGGSATGVGAAQHEALEAPHTPSRGPVDIAAAAYPTPTPSLANGAQVDSVGLSGTFELPSSPTNSSSISSGTHRPGSFASHSGPQLPVDSDSNTPPPYSEGSQAQTPDHGGFSATPQPSTPTSIALSHVQLPFSSLPEPQRLVVECVRELMRKDTNARGVHVNDIIWALKDSVGEWTAESFLDAFDVAEDLRLIESLDDDAERYVALPEELPSPA
ncbi:uncharacterized protein EI90DRAFT_3032453 [Cantharellus anzutake]|uniref:uncharacterized protein n=1 Tax=Cantharellus anzutake TaxID=1750568 RepID=UPI00190535E6|nr:uncharacterized protein EI90DRAFT_3032453 [Cantharellus anzutake]KAF8342204.1 hypothetical protein EI90DRAFT_3032453 [Cantharellus anzutake]